MDEKTTVEVADMSADHGLSSDERDSAAASREAKPEKPLNRGVYAPNGRTARRKGRQNGR